MLDVDALQFRVQESHIERRVVDDQFRIADELHKFARNERKGRLLGEPLARQAVHLLPRPRRCRARGFKY